ncbi:MAG: 23S rRNA (adenine(2030)-N(6))-methyltransferase RlmJ [Gammaproteobacteria bacterium]|nr:23S rRNA (adenine(2030)-N(6))-methyltransferase RlmJ [Gammaproteobacteria bacterium]
MNYRHIYHAGNFADVFKHLLLVRLLESFKRKDKGFAYLETHAGAGAYDLQAADAGKTGEYLEGIGRLWKEPIAGVEEYLAAVRAHNPNGRLRYYPGSPGIAHSLLRPQDRMRLAECVPEECAHLQVAFADDKRVSISCADGYTALKAWLPPPERRGLVLIDPPYERSDEWERLRLALAFAVDRWPTGTFAVWYPLKVGAPVERLKSKLVAAGIRKVLVAELNVWPMDTPFRLNGCGLLIVNPPWQLDAELPALLEPLAKQLQQGPNAAAEVSWLVPE